MSFVDYLVAAACAVLTIGSLLRVFNGIRDRRLERRRWARGMVIRNRDRFAMEMAKWN